MNIFYYTFTFFLLTPVILMGAGISAHIESDRPGTLASATTAWIARSDVLRRIAMRNAASLARERRPTNVSNITLPTPILSITGSKRKRSADSDIAGSSLAPIRVEGAHSKETGDSKENIGSNGDFGISQAPENKRPRMEADARSSSVASTATMESLLGDTDTPRSISIASTAAGAPGDDAETSIDAYEEVEECITGRSTSTASVAVAAATASPLERARRITPIFVECGNLVGRGVTFPRKPVNLRELYAFLTAIAATKNPEGEAALRRVFPTGTFPTDGM